ncbi:MAG: serine/threonine-protein kinase [bacterium]
MDSLIGKTIDNYRIIEIIGRGGMGVVFKALDITLDKTVALKMIDPSLAKDENFLKRFQTEARALARLEHENIVKVHALRETEVGFFMVMEYFEAKTIGDFLKDRGAFSVEETLSISRQVLDAINHAHKVGVIHRDIKPNNVLFSKGGKAKVMDFGLAKVMRSHDGASTVTQMRAGTLYYMSPEQIKGLANVDKRSDIYSLGMTFYEMLTGRVPFDKDDSEFVIQKQIVDGKITSPLKYDPMIPKALVKIIMKSIDKDPDKRYQSVEEMNLALRQYEDRGQSIQSAVKKEFTEKPVVTKGSAVKNILIGTAAVVILVIASIFIYKEFIKEKDVIIKNGNEQEEEVIIPTNNEGNPPKLFSKLEISSNPPGAQVLINDRVAGTTTFFKDSLTEEFYSIKITKEGYEDWYDTQVYVDLGETKKLNVNLVATGGTQQIKPLETTTTTTTTSSAKATLVLDMSPSGAIYIDGKKKSVEEGEKLRITVDAGNHSIKFEHPEYGTKITSMDLRGGEEKILTCYFQQRVNIQSLNETGQPFWGVVYINEKITDLVTPCNTQLSPGNYKISVKRSGYMTEENYKMVSVSPSFEKKPQSLVFHLKAAK